MGTVTRVGSTSWVGWFTARFGPRRSLAQGLAGPTRPGARGSRGPRPRSRAWHRAGTRPRARGAGGQRAAPAEPRLAPSGVCTQNIKPTIPGPRRPPVALNWRIMLTTLSSGWNRPTALPNDREPARPTQFHGRHCLFDVLGAPPQHVQATPPDARDPFGLTRAVAPIDPPRWCRSSARTVSRPLAC
jgi:hypothetical protein